MADAAEQRLRGEADELILSVHRQWWQLWQLRREADIRRTDREQLGGITALATARLPTAGDPATVLRLGYEAEVADTLLTSLDERIKAETVRFNLLLGRPAEQPLLLPDSLPLPELPPVEADLMAAILVGNPALAAWENEAAAWQARAEMERREGYPSAGLGLEYRIVAPSSSPTVMNGMNGRDMIMPMVSLRLPLWRGKYRARERQNRLRGEEALWRRQSEADALTAETAALCADFRSMLRQAGLAGRQRRTVEALLALRMAAFRTGEAGLTDILDLRRELLDSNLREVEAIVAAHIAVAEIEKLISKKDILD
jgi:outer membrane protein TolC